MATKRKRQYSTIEDKIKIISYAEQHPKLGVRAIAEAHSIGKTQVSEILQNKSSITSAFESNSSTHKKCRLSKYSDVN